jgi:hypothetical protein
MHIVISIIYVKRLTIPEPAEIISEPIKEKKERIEAPLLSMFCVVMALA